MNPIRVPNSLDPDQTQCFVKSYLGLSCVQGYKRTTKSHSYDKKYDTDLA